MGETATRVQARLRDALARERPALAWETEYRLGATPVDVAGLGGPTVLVELEWRRADPADNAATLFRELLESDTEVERDRVHVVQAFTRYYDLESGGVSTKRRNAEFVGERLAAAVDRVTYRGLTLEIDPPKRGGELPTGWEDAVAALAARAVEW